MKGTRDRGHLRYVLLYGVVGWGLPTAVLFSLLMSWWVDEEEFSDILPGALVGFALGGVLFGELMWRAIRRRRGRQEDDRPAGGGSPREGPAP